MILEDSSMTGSLSAYHMQALFGGDVLPEKRSSMHMLVYLVWGILLASKAYACTCRILATTLLYLIWQIVIGYNDP